MPAGAPGGRRRPRFPVSGDRGARCDNNQKRLRAPLRAGSRTRTEKQETMQFEYTRRSGALSPVTGAATFRVKRLTGISERKGSDLSHLIDPSYEYQSPRELRWHLADRFGLAPAKVSVREHA